MWVSDLSLQAQGFFCCAWSPSAATHPPNAQTWTNGHISHLQQRPSEHKQLCLPPQPFVLTMATAPCLSHVPSCISSMGVGGTLLITGAEEGVKSGCVGVLRLLSCFERVSLHYSSVLRETQSR